MKEKEKDSKDNWPMKCPFFRWEKLSLKGTMLKPGRPKLLLSHQIWACSVIPSTKTLECINGSEKGSFLLEMLRTS